MAKKKATSSDPKWEYVHIQNYARSVSNWRSWCDAADEMQYAAEVLKPHVLGWWAGVTEWSDRRGQGVRPFPFLGCHSIAMMLLAFVVENLCKGSLIRDGAVDVSVPSLVSGGIPGTLKTHKLRDLVRAVGLDATDGEQELLARMTRASVWRGRYPAPVRYDDSIHTLWLDTGAKHAAAWYGEKDIERIEAFIARLRAHLGIKRSYTVARDAAP
jgi:hypothetical protein